MNRRTIVLAIGALAAAGFAAGGYAYTRRAVDVPAGPAVESTTFVRPHSPILGSPDARVTIVEFFDPACEACRAFYPIVKRIQAMHGDKLRVVLRYTPLHHGSEEAVRILETARLQNLFAPVLEALLARQPEWANHNQPDMEKAWAAAAAGGLDVAKAKEMMLAPHITAAINRDVEDAKAVGVTGTPTFFVNGKPLPSFGPKQLHDLVGAEVAQLN